MLRKTKRTTSRRPIDKLFDEAQILRDNGRIDEAVKLYKEVRHHAQKKYDLWLASECLHMIGVAYAQAEKTEEADKFLEEAQKEFEARKDVESAGMVYRDRGLVAKKCQDYPLAESMMKKSLENLLSVRYPNMGHVGISRVKLGLIKAAQGDLRLGIDIIKKAIGDLENSRDTFFLSTAHFDLAQLLRESGDSQQAAKEAIDARTILNNVDPTGKKFTERRKEIQEFLVGKSGSRLPTPES
jgi:tetratricopeptide (TPR) repeat protein